MGVGRTWQVLVQKGRFTDTFLGTVLRINRAFPLPGPQPCEPPCQTVPSIKSPAFSNVTVASRDLLKMGLLYGRVGFFCRQDYISSVRWQESDWGCEISRRMGVLVLELCGLVVEGAIGRSRGTVGFHNDPRISSASRISGANSRPTPSSVIHIIRHLHLLSKMQKMSQSFSNNINSLNTTVSNFIVADNRSNILAWLSPLNPKLRHQDIQGHRVEKLGEWLLQTEVFRAWNAGSGGESDSTVLFCYGNPGVGKTFIR